MSDFTMEAAVERARRSAVTGDAASLGSQVQGILTLDRDGTAPTRELRMLELVASARLADLAGVDRLLDSLEPLAPSDWRRLHGWLLDAPEMSHAAYADFVRELDRRQRRHHRVPAMRRFTPALAILLAASAISLLLLAWRVSPLPAEESNLLAIEAVLGGRWGALEEALPAAWRNDLNAAAAAVAAHASAQTRGQVTGEVQSLAKAVRDAALSPSGGALARRLIGPMASIDDLRRVADGLAAWSDSPWLHVTAWSDGSAARWQPQGDALFVWRVLLHHAPLGAWMPGWFGADFRVDPLRVPSVRVRPLVREEGARTLQVTIDAGEWPLSTVRVGRHWVPQPLVARWEQDRGSLTPERLNAEVTQRIEAQLAASMRAMTIWVRAWVDGTGPDAPDSSNLPWWVP